MNKFKLLALSLVCATVAFGYNTSMDANAQCAKRATKSKDQQLLKTSQARYKKNAQTQGNKITLSRQPKITQISTSKQTSRSTMR